MRGLVLVVLLSFVTSAGWAWNKDLTEFKKRYNGVYPESVKISRCNVCHQNGSEFNSYGRDYASRNSNFAEIEPWDSDADGVSNIDEIAAGTYPAVQNNH